MQNFVSCMWSGTPQSSEEKLPTVHKCSFLEAAIFSSRQRMSGRLDIFWNDGIEIVCIVQVKNSMDNLTGKELQGFLSTVLISKYHIPNERVDVLV